MKHFICSFIIFCNNVLCGGWGQDDPCDPWCMKMWHVSPEPRLLARVIMCYHCSVLVSTLPITRHRRLSTSWPGHVMGSRDTCAPIPWSSGHLPRNTALDIGHPNMKHGMSNFSFNARQIKMRNTKHFQIHPSHPPMQCFLSNKNGFTASWPWYQIMISLVTSWVTFTTQELRRQVAP